MDSHETCTQYANFVHVAVDSGCPFLNYPGTCLLVVQSITSITKLLVRGSLTLQHSEQPNLTFVSANGLSPSGTHKTKCATVKILKFGTSQTIAIIILKIEKFDVTLH